jgi:hypothetical protein
MVKFLHENPCQWPLESHERSNYQLKNIFYNLTIEETDPPSATSVLRYFCTLNSNLTNWLNTLRKGEIGVIALFLHFIFYYFHFILPQRV